jgi:hypothetical protein
MADEDNIKEKFQTLLKRVEELNSKENINLYNIEQESWYSKADELLIEIVNDILGTFKSDHYLHKKFLSIKFNPYKPVMLFHSDKQKKKNYDKGFYDISKLLEETIEYLSIYPISRTDDNRNDYISGDAVINPIITKNSTGDSSIYLNSNKYNNIACKKIKSWHEEWWGKTIIIVICGLLLRYCTNFNPIEFFSKLIK